MYLLILTNPIHTFDIDSNLHPTMYLLIPVCAVCAADVALHLHPTMYLLIRAFRFVKLVCCNIYIPLCIY